MNKKVCVENKIEDNHSIQAPEKNNRLGQLGSLLFEEKLTKTIISSCMNVLLAVRYGKRGRNSMWTSLWSPQI